MVLNRLACALRSAGSERRPGAGRGRESQLAADHGLHATGAHLDELPAVRESDQ